MSTYNDDVDAPTLELTDIDLNSELWHKLLPYLAARLALLRRKNDAQLGPEQTATLRGQIAELKNLLAAGTRQD
jgi:hypothetical protein